MIVMIEQEQLEEYAEQLGLEHPDYERLEEYVRLVSSLTTTDNEEDYITQNLAKWVEDEQECWYGSHASVAEFAQFYYENYDTENRIPSWIVVNWEESWYANLRHEFYYGDNGDVWAEIY